MAVVQDISTRIIQKHDTTEQWEHSNTFIPRKGEIIAYDAEYGGDGVQLQPPRLKIGDGVHIASALPFIVIDELSPVAFSGTYTDLTNRPDLTLGGIAAILGLTTVQLQQLIALAKITTVDSTQVTIDSNLKTQSYDTQN